MDGDGRVKAKSAYVFALLYTLESTIRALVSSIIPITAYELLKDEQRVSVLYTLVSIASLLGTLTVPMLIAFMARRRVYSLGVVGFALASLAFVTNTIEGQVAGMFLRVVANSCVSVVLSLYIMDNVPKTQLVKAESIRLSMSTVAWTLGPFSGGWLYANYGLWAVHGTAIGVAALLFCLFWYFRLGEGAVIKAAKAPPVNPAKNFARFFRQPRLSLAWFIAFARSAFWTMYFVYGPILLVSTGQGKMAGGIFLSLGNIMLFSTLVWAKIARKIGLRISISVCFAGLTLFLLAAGYFGNDFPLVSAGLLLAATVFGSALDGLGSTPFLRAVKPRERAEMTSVYRTFLDFSDLLPQLAFSVVLLFFGFGSIFVTMAVLTGIAAFLTWRYLPKSM
jgi:predicted MFS family arabinose efflux permease